MTTLTLASSVPTRVKADLLVSSCLGLFAGVISIAYWPGDGAMSYFLLGNFLGKLSFNFLGVVLVTSGPFLVGTASSASLALMANLAGAECCLISCT